MTSAVQDDISWGGKRQQTGSVQIESVFCNITFIQVCKVNQSAQRHVGIFCALCFIQVHIAAD